ncbi:MAG TPA: nitroreductase family deazaflavin-dependent oxidoreductase [Mycobacterium sp.]|nr:nitroreductase family deazaflavin-dependent oxidoreductase [Mycobacterium sp.]HTX97280.1 nitroreductase family deazaflavin-dependent oxidoreductase [Mycobacterium sp.]
MGVQNAIRNSEITALLLKYFARAHIWVYRRTNGTVGAKRLRFPAALLTTTVRKSDEPHTTATLYLRGGDRVILPAAFVGRQEHPSWYLNLKENPEVQVQIRAERLDLIARDATGAERDRYWASLTRIYPPYRKYREATNRVVPLVVCERR